jgi:hypothetical protein
VPVGREAHALQEEVEGVAHELVCHPGHLGRLVEDGLRVDVDVARDEMVGTVAANAVAALFAAVVLVLK